MESSSSEDSAAHEELSNALANLSEQDVLSGAFAEICPDAHCVDNPLGRAELRLPRSRGVGVWPSLYGRPGQASALGREDFPGISRRPKRGATTRT